MPTVGSPSQVNHTELTSSFAWQMMLTLSCLYIKSVYNVYKGVYNLFLELFSVYFLIVKLMSAWNFPFFSLIFHTYYDMLRFFCLFFFVQHQTNVICINRPKCWLLLMIWMLGQWVRETLDSSFLLTYILLAFLCSSRASPYNVMWA